MLDLDVDNLFEKHSVAEIDSVGQQIRNEIEKKREELRSMVGERYRDLLKAADTINNMRKTSSDAILNIEQVLFKCRSVHDNQLIGFNPERSKSTLHPRGDPSKLELYSVSLQIKILTSLSELIWNHLDNDEFFIAAQLFILARHINTGLRLNKSTVANGGGAELIVNRFPLIKNQWAILQQFFGIIKDRCNARLETEDLQPDVASKCLASLILLDSPNVDSLLQNLINLRIKAFCDVLNDNSGKFSVVRDKLLASLNVLNGTVHLVHKCFIELQQGQEQAGNKRGLLADELHRLSSDKAPPTISHVTTILSPKQLQLLPDIISKYKPNVSVTEVPLAAVHNVMQRWMAVLSQIAGTSVKSLVNLIGSVKVIREIKETSSSDLLRTNNQWTEICADLGLPRNMNFYRQFYHTLINDRVKEIIQSSWTETQQKLTEEIHALLEATATTQHNMVKFLWTEEQSDIPLSLNQALDVDHKKRKLLMKSLGFIPEILEICTNFDRNLESLFKDVDNYLANDGNSVATEASEELRQDQMELVRFLVEASKTNMVTLLRKEEKIQDKESFLQMARLFQAVKELCPHLRLILCYRMTGVSMATTEENWIPVGKQLEEESIAYWIRFADQYFAEWRVSDSFARSTTEFATFLEDFAAWQSVAIVENDEQGNAVESAIRIPSQPSVRVQTTLFRVVTELNKIAPHTIPVSVVTHLTEKIVAELLSDYERMNETELVRGNQKVSLQFYFDVKYLTLLLVPRDVQNKSLPEVAQRLTNLFKSQVDPFDFELFFVHLTKNVKIAVQRSQYQFGVIIPNMEHLATVLGGEKQATATDKEPNVLALSTTGVNWFPLLPIAAPVVKTETVVPVEVVKKKENENRRIDRSQNASRSGQQQSQSRSSQKSGAASFFGNFFQN